MNQTKPTLILENPWYIITYFFENIEKNIQKNLIKIYKKLENIAISPYIKLNIFISNQNSNTKISFVFTSYLDDFEINLDDFLEIINSQKIQEIEFLNKKTILKKYIICSNFLENNISTSLNKNIFVITKNDLKIVYSSQRNQKIIIETVNNIIKIDILYNQILNFYKNFLQTYSEIQQTHKDLIWEYFAYTNWNLKKQKNLDFFNNKIEQINAINFWITYDIKNIENVIENISILIKEIWWEKTILFVWYLQKLNLILDILKNYHKKNSLIKTEILENFIKITQTQNEKEKINHIKNIKEIIWFLAFVEIFINWISQTTKLFKYSKEIEQILNSTDFLRMIFIVFCLILYFFYVFIYKKFIKI